MPTKNNLGVLSSTDTEMSLLSCIFRLGRKRESDLYDLEVIFGKVTADDFTATATKTVFIAMQALYQTGSPIDLVTLSEQLRRGGELSKIGDIEFLCKISDILPSAVYYQKYIDILLDYTKLRKLGNLGLYLGDIVTSGTPASEIEKEVENRLSLLNNNFEFETVESIAVAVEKEQERIEKIRQGEYDDFGLPTGFPVLDRTLWGLQKSDLIILGARAGVGKTAMALNILDYCANERKKKCLFFSLEMPKNQIARRLISLRSGVDSTEIKKAKELKADDLAKLKKAQEAIKEGYLYIDDISNNTVRAMALKAKYLQRKEGLDLVVVDYLQFVKPSAKSGNRFQDVGEIARDLKVMARQLNVPLIALCQLNRALDYKKDGKEDKREPVLADLRESGEIENNADIVIFLDPKDGEFNEARNVELIIAKFRNGQMRKIRMEYRGNIFKFKELDSAPKPQAKQTKISDLIEIDDDDSMPF